MSELFDLLQDRYRALLARREKGESQPELWEAMSAFISDARQAGATLEDLDERSQVRAWMRLLADMLHAATGVYPDVTLPPLARGRLTASRMERRKPGVFWCIGWIAAGAAALSIVVWALVTRSSPSPPASPTEALEIVGSVEVGIGREGSADLELQTDVMCAGATSIAARFSVVEPLPAGTRWGWRLTQAGRLVASALSLTWETEGASLVTHVALPDARAMAGRYTLTFLVGDRPTAVRDFTVLTKTAQVSRLTVSTPDGEGGGEFAPGVEALLITYDYKGLCPAQPITRTLYWNGERMYESVQAWSGASEGHAVLEYRALDGSLLPSGEYEVVVGAERTAFTVAEQPPPAFWDITVALGVRPDGKPILPADIYGPFGYSTRLVYVIFHYAGMRDGQEWSVVWTRDGQEVHRQEETWSAAAAATEDTHWVAYYNEDGEPLGGGYYAVTLYIGAESQGTVSFWIFRPPPEEEE